MRYSFRQGVASWLACAVLAASACTSAPLPGSDGSSPATAPTIPASIAAPSPGVTPASVGPTPPAAGASPTGLPAPTPIATTVGDEPVVIISTGPGSYPIDVIFAFGSLWTANHRTNDVSRFDPSTYVETARVTSGPGLLRIAGPSWFAVADDAVWVTNQFGVGVTRIDPSTNEVTATAGNDEPCGPLAVASGSVWMHSCTSEQLIRIDPSTNSVPAELPARGLSAPIAVDDELFMGGPDGLVRFDPESSVFSTVGGGSGFALGYDGQTVWTADRRQVSRVDPLTGKVVATFDISGGEGRTVAFVGDTAWVAVGGRELVQIDMASNEIVRTLTLGPTPGKVVFAEGALWVTDFDTNTLWRFVP
jgi:streptogramin lyase